MYVCDICDFLTSKHKDILQHYQTQKHLKRLAAIDVFECNYCNKTYKYEYGLEKHKSECIKNQINLEHTLSKTKEESSTFNNNTINSHNSTNNTNSHNTNSHNTTNNTNSHNTTNINISKVEFLNLNFSEVIDIESFIDNLENNPEFDLTSEETGNILFNQQNGGLLSAVASIVYYIKDNLIKQYQKKGKHISRKDIITPFILYDKGLREHFEKNINGKWDKTLCKQNIEKIVDIIDRKIFKHHQQYMCMNHIQKKKTVNGVLKSSCFSKLNNISNPNLYCKI
jgi:hypothetical protein